MKKTLTVSFVFVFLAMGLAVQAQAQLVGPLNPDTGFPLWVRDVANTQVGLCTAGGGNEAPPCPGFEPDPLTGAILEAMYYGAEAIVDMGDAAGTSVLAIFGVEAAGADPVAGDPALVSNFILLRIRTDNPPAADRAFSVAHPWGAPITGTIPANENDHRVEIAVDLEAPFPPDGLVPLAGPITHFIGNGTAGACFGVNFLGDGVTLANLIAPVPGGSGLTNISVTVDGTTVESGLAVQGMLFVPPGAENVVFDRSTVDLRGTRGTGTLIGSTIFAGATMNVTAVNGAPTGPIPLASDPATGRFFARFPVAGATAPVTVTVNVTSADPLLPGGTIDIPVVMQDTVAVRNATFSINRRTGVGGLSLSPTSSISAPRPTFTVESTDKLGNPVAGGFSQAFPPTGRRGALRVENLTSPPGFVKITSSFGGQIILPVTIR